MIVEVTSSSSHASDCVESHSLLDGETLIEQSAGAQAEKG